MLPLWAGRQQETERRLQEPPARSHCRPGSQVQKMRPGIPEVQQPQPLKLSWRAQEPGGAWEEHRQALAQQGHLC